MLKNLSFMAFSYLDKIMAWTDPSWWIWLSVVVYILCTIHVLPLEFDKENHEFSDVVLIWTRKLCLAWLGIFVLLAPVLLYLVFGLLSSGNSHDTSRLFLDWVAEMFWKYWTLPVAAVVAGVAQNFIWHRYLLPYISNLRRGLRVNQHEDSYSDAREEAEKYESKSFDPEIYYKDDFYFMGLDEQNLPIYIDRKTFEETHTGIIGPTRFGKGVSAGIILQQSIRFGNSAWMVDPKGDKYIPYIMEKEARRQGRPFIYLDLNPDGRGYWHPFKGGVLRDRRSRILSTFGLEPGGTNADVYKSKERGIVDDLLRACPEGKIADMLEACGKVIGKGDLSELRDGLKEWAQISTFTANKKRKGHSIEESLLNNAVVYVKGSLTDGVVKRATRTYISELMQEVIRLSTQRTTHVTCFFDEIRFVISNEIVDGMATVAGFRVNLLLATQAISDLQNLEDKTINGAALAKSFEVNCQIKTLYKAGDDITAKWGETISGTKFIRVANNEKTKVNTYGGEVWDKTRAFSKQEVPMFHRNVFLNLSPMVSVLFVPSGSPRVMFTSWVTVDISVCPWEKKTVPEQDQIEEVDSSGDEAGPGEQTMPNRFDSAVKPKMRANPNLKSSTGDTVPNRDIEVDVKIPHEEAKND
ncbi:conjugal transfer protein TraC [Janthinobacterium sp. MDT1-19]|uniref:conjugal transfer protein TraC n=1 Tax=Janthinobacterium sp. MDT1-19 TaxID=1259339 RepID=UPI003F2853F9